jgi:guanylate kinase
MKSKAKGIPVVISAPSGGGKSTIAQKLIKKIPSAVISISCTTRKPRAGEKEGTDYYFVSQEEFQKKIKKGDLLEWAEVHGSYYGTPLSKFNENLENGKDVILTIDVQGGLAVKRFYPKGIYIFLIPPSWDELKSRLEKRGSDDEKSMEIRLKNAKKEMDYLSHYEYLVVNHDLDQAVEDVASILMAEHCKLNRIDKRTVSILN